MPGNVENADEARCVLFKKTTSPDVLPPTSDALKYHILRAHYQALIWNLAYHPTPNIPELYQYGWKKKEKSLTPKWTTLS